MLPYRNDITTLAARLRPFLYSVVKEYTTANPSGGALYPTFTPALAANTAPATDVNIFNPGTGVYMRPAATTQVAGVFRIPAGYTGTSIRLAAIVEPAAGGTGTAKLSLSAYIAEINNAMGIYTVTGAVTDVAAAALPGGKYREAISTTMDLSGNGIGFVLDCTVPGAIVNIVFERSVTNDTFNRYLYCLGFTIGYL